VLSAHSTRGCVVLPFVLVVSARLKALVSFSRSLSRSILNNTPKRGACTGSIGMERGTMRPGEEGANHSPSKYDDMATP